METSLDDATLSETRCRFAVGQRWIVDNEDARRRRIMVTRVEIRFLSPHAIDATLGTNSSPHRWRRSRSRRLLLGQPHAEGRGPAPPILQGSPTTPRARTSHPQARPPRHRGARGRTTSSRRRRRFATTPCCARTAMFKPSSSFPVWALVGVLAAFLLGRGSKRKRATGKRGSRVELALLSAL